MRHFSTPGLNRTSKSSKTFLSLTKSSARRVLLTLRQWGRLTNSEGLCKWRCIGQTIAMRLGKVVIPLILSYTLSKTSFQTSAKHLPPATHLMLWSLLTCKKKEKIATRIKLRKASPKNLGYPQPRIISPLHVQTSLETEVELETIHIAM
jgi:hypothetical protein